MLNQTAKRILIDISIIVGTLLIVFFVVPAYMISISVSDYLFLNFSILFEIAFFLLCICMFFFLILYWVCFLVFSDHRILRSILIFSFYWFMLSGLLFPLIEGGGLVEPISTRANFTNIVLVVFFSFLLTYLVQREQKNLILIFTAVFLTSNVLISSTNLPFLNNKNSSIFENLHTLSSDSNIIVLSLDGISGSVINELFNNEPALTSDFKDFTLFTNTYSSFPATKESIMSELYGQKKFNDIALDSVELDNKLKEIPLLINAVDQDIYSYGQYNMYVHDSSRALPMGGIVQLINESDKMMVNQVLDFFDYLIVRLGTRNLLQLIADGPSTLVTNFYQPSEIETESNYGNFISKLQNHKGPNWDVKTILTVWGFSEWVNRLKVEKKPRSLRFLHFSFSHFPVDFDENCNYRSNDREWFANNQNEIGIENETRCSLKHLSSFLKKLNSLNVYDNSLIILKSDHGMPVSYYTSYPKNIRLNNHSVWGYDRYRPFMMIKGFNQKQSSILKKHETVNLSDLSRTICNASNIYENCSIYSGLDLIADELISRPKEFFMYVPKNERSSYLYNDLTEIKLLREDNVFSQLQKNNVSVSEQVSYENEDLNSLAIVQLRDLKKIHDALGKYFTKYGNYPASIGWDGLYTHSGNASENWIQGLVPEFLNSLPRDPRLNSSPYTQYLYKSNGKDFKLISENGFIAGKVEKSYVDPIRSSHAFGFWSDGAVNW